MRARSSTSRKNSGEVKRYYWKRRPSEIRGYQRTLYLTDDSGDYIRVDYNLKEKRVRLYIEDAEDGGIPYYSVITAGKITAERNASTGRSFSLNDKFSKRADIFSSIPNKEIIRLINKNYGISENREEVQKRLQARKQELEKTRVRYFGQEGHEAAAEGAARSRQRKIRMVDLIDLFIGLNICLAFYYFNRTMFATGIIAAFYGILMGLIDIFFRNREPVFTKIIVFVLLGSVLYVYGYYWG